MNVIEKYQYPLAVTGSVCVGYLAIKLCLHVLKAIRSFFLAPLFGLGVNPATLGKWAVVTGATDGIGKAYAMALAKKGMNIVLISRTASKLEATAKEIREKANVEIKCVAVDFSKGSEIYANMKSELEDLNIGILVNNVGVSYNYPEFLIEVKDRDSVFEKMIHTNVFSVTFMTSMILPEMAARRKGAIVNIGSASCFGFPLLTVYAATKAYVDSFSRNLSYEYRNKGVIIQSVFPHHVATKMSKIRKSSFSSPSSEAYAKSLLATLGLEEATTGYFSHWLMSSIIHDLLPSWLLMRITLSMSQGIRAKALKKLAAKKE